MSRAFFSLYLVVVVSLLTVGWGLDRLWEAYEATSPATLRSEALLSVVELAARGRTFEENKNLVETIARADAVRFDLLHLEDLSRTALAERIRQGELVAFQDGDGRDFLYRKVKDQPQVLVLERDAELGQPPWLEMLLAALFYLAIGLAVFFWIWPLSRDLAKLEKQAETLGTIDLDSRVQLNSRSTAYRLGRAFNRMADRIRELIDAQRDMTNAVSHELRTPLARMKFALEMARGSNNLRDALDRVDSITRDVIEMDELINQLLNYASTEQSEPNLDWKPGDMAALVRDLVLRLRGKYLDAPDLDRKCDITIEERSVEREFVCDWPLMERAIQNLLQNAIRHCSRRVDISLESSGNLQRVIVDDDGQGIPATHREEIFLSFVRLRHTGDTQSAGFGLGLAITRRIARWHRGEVQIEDSPLGGARFVMSWPLPAKCTE